MIPLVDLGAQYASLRAEIDAAIARVLASGAYGLGSPEVAAFEREFAAYCGVSECVACGNGTDALALALRACGVGPGDEVITVAHTFVATVSAIVSVGAVPVLTDVRDDTLLMDPALLPAALTPRTRAIVPVHLYGHAVDMDAALGFARAHGLRVIEDAAQAHGARWRGRRVGSFGDAAAFSFYPTKNLGAFGDAGAVVTRDAAVAEWLRRARDHGRSGRHVHEFFAGNSRMDALQAAVLRVKLARLDLWNLARREWAARYDATLTCRRVVPYESSESVYHLYVARVRARDRALAAVHGAGVGAAVHYPTPVHLQPAWTWARPSLPVTERAAGEVLSLPLYPELPAEAVTLAAGVLAGFV